MSERLPNYLRTYRKHRGLSQEEVAYLLGRGNATNVSLHESGERTPRLENALAYQAILQVPTDELFAGTYAKVEDQIARRARELTDKLPEEQRADDPHLARKLETLEALAAPVRA